MTDASFIDKTLIAPIQLDDVHGHWEFRPRNDITAYELALITELFVAMVVRQTRLDWREFLTRDRSIKLISPDGTAEMLMPAVNLARHFKDL